ncbi:hypothetical protein BO85DRAFT_443194 [Aspergillus piperis CBS 112811]|uniref:Uncharacterized protein n=1 Tax=Aspergillus piperis CBS 112811 TaxID=1448313 RepID=A0A8G1QS10_9EURO|nr:hypothetical protein BO85DRAFT_443194 [Aspergillus piperis CBS 112811]RAH52517.1 hypothetical protein BO85DRAFT_443194 [Aspergillus piperis CBS 112811]
MSDDEWPAGSQLPAIRQLSDVMWIEWAAQAAAGGVDAGSRKYIFQMNVVNMDTRAVIERAMGGVPASRIRLAGHAQRQCSGLGLINHKDSLGADQSNPDEITGLKKVSKIRIWTNEDLCYIPPDLDDESDYEVEDVDMDDKDRDMAHCYHMLFFIDTVSEPDFMDY